MRGTGARPPRGELSLISRAARRRVVVRVNPPGAVRTPTPLGRARDSSSSSRPLPALARKTHRFSSAHLRLVALGYPIRTLRVKHPSEGILPVAKFSAAYAK